jgi:Uma2 family endonuclease
MSSVDRPAARPVPRLVAGQRLDQPTFHARYEAMPPGTRAELIGGVVYMPSPLSDDHGATGDDVALWLGHYRRFTPGLRGGLGTTTILGDSGEAQPDHQLRVLPEYGGQARVEDGYVSGAPELIVEIARSSKPYDLDDKRRDYERAGVREYVVVALDPNQVHWFAQRDGRFVDWSPGPDGVFRSGAFPGLWLDAAALFAGDLERLIHVLDQGLDTPEHAAFVAELAARRIGP